MHIRKIRGLKKLGVLAAVAMLTVVSVSTTTFAGSQLYVSEEGIGIEVQSPSLEEMKAKGDINDNYTSVSGGTLWTTWRSGSSYRANYDHASKTHRCTAQNGNGVTSRSEWTIKGYTARSAFIPQSLMNNRSYASTK